VGRSSARTAQSGWARATPHAQRAQTATSTHYGCAWRSTRLPSAHSSSGTSASEHPKHGMLDTEELASPTPRRSGPECRPVNFFQRLEQLPTLIIVSPTVTPMRRVLRVILIELQAMVRMPVALLTVPSRCGVRTQSNSAAQHECRKRVFKELIHWNTPSVFLSKLMIPASTNHYREATGHLLT
jgi:hypothetical protein